VKKTVQYIPQKLIALQSKGMAKLGNIVVETLFPDVLPWVASLGNKICVCEAQMF